MCVLYNSHSKVRHVSYLWVWRAIPMPNLSGPCWQTFEHNEGGWAAHDASSQQVGQDANSMARVTARNQLLKNSGLCGIEVRIWSAAISLFYLYCHGRIPLGQCSAVTRTMHWVLTGSMPFMVFVKDHLLPEYRTSFASMDDQRLLRATVQ